MVVVDAYVVPTPGEGFYRLAQRLTATWIVVSASMHRRSATNTCQTHTPVRKNSRLEAFHVPLGQPHIPVCFAESPAGCYSELVDVLLPAMKGMSYKRYSNYL